MKLLKRAKRGASTSKVQQTLIKRVRRQVSKAAKGDVDNSTSSSPSSDFNETPSLPVRETHGNKIVRLAQSAPGSLLESSGQEVAKFLQTKGGVGVEAADTLAPLTMTYFRSVWQEARPPAEVGLRNNSELETLATVIDRLLEGSMAAVDDILMQRFRCVRMASTHGWRVASQLELSNRDDATLVPSDVREEALCAHHRDARVQDGLRKAKGS